MTAIDPSTRRTDALRRRLAAVAALGLGGVALVTGALSMRGDLGRAAAAVVLILVAVALAWSAATRRGRTRVVAGVLAVLAVVSVVVVVLTAEARGLMAVVVVALVSGSAALSTYALRRDRLSLRAAATPGAEVGPARQGVLIMNLKSGGGKAERFGLEEEARRVGVEAVVLRPGDDLRQLAQDAIDGGADVIGMAGGDGSQALVASMAMAADVAMVCIPAGTRNHFALDLGLDREDVVGALDAFGDAVERRIDLATVGDRVFVNNVSLGRLREGRAVRRVPGRQAPDHRQAPARAGGARRRPVRPPPCRSATAPSSRGRSSSWCPTTPISSPASEGSAVGPVWTPAPWGS